MLNYALIEEKKSQLLGFIQEFQETQQNADDLLSLETKLVNAKHIGLNLTFDIDGEIVPLEQIAGVTTEELYLSLKDDLEVFIKYLSKQNLVKQEKLLTQVQFTNESPKEPGNKKDEMKHEMKHDHSISEEDGTPMYFLQKFIEATLQHKVKDDYINPIDIWNDLPTSSKNILHVSDVHDVLREYVERENLKIVNYTRCYKCEANYAQYHDSLPRNVICNICREDIVNVEFHYQVIEEVSK